MTANFTFRKNFYLVVPCLIVTTTAIAAKGPTSSSHPPAASSLESLRDTQEVFRAVTRDMRPYLVRIETIGGAQPRQRMLPGLVPEEIPPEGENEPGGKGKGKGKGKTREPNPFQDRPGSDFEIADGPTTGVIYSADGYILTSSFNFVREPLLITATLPDGRRLDAQLIARDQVRKIALLKVDAEGLGTPTWCELSEVEVGQWAIALGLGFGGDSPSVTVGIVSALFRMNKNALQTDAKLSPANYGGPLCDARGRVLGLCVPMAQRPGELAGVELYDSGVGFAVPKHRIDQIVAILRTGRSLYRGWLGISMGRQTADGIIIRNVADPSPMKEAGVRPGDRIISANTKPIKNHGQLVQALYMIPAGEKVYLHMGRNGREFGIAINLARSGDLGQFPKLLKPYDPSNPIPRPGDDD